MNKKICVSLTCALALSTTLVASEDLGVISVDSSTIKVTESSKTEVSTVSYIDNKRIEEIDPKHINELLQAIPGVTSDVRAGEIVEIHMRGVGQQEFMGEDTGVAIVVDGVPLWQNGGKVRLNLSDIKSVKVIKGGASYLYGNTALAGAVIITTNKPKDKDEYSISAETGSHNYKNYGIGLLKSTDDFSINLNGNRRSSDGYWLESSLWNKSISGKLSYYLDDSSDVTLGIDKTKKYEEASRASVTGVTEASTTPEGNGRNSYKKDNYVDLDKYFINYSKDFENNSNLIVNIYNYNDLYDYTSSPQDTTGDGNNDTYTNHTNQDIVQKGIKAEYNIEDDNFAYMFGLEIGDRAYEDIDNRIADYTKNAGLVFGVDDDDDYYEGERAETHNDQEKNAIYGEFKYAFTPKLNTTLNVRHDIQKDDYLIDSHDYNGTVWTDSKTARDKTFKENSYRVGAAYELSKNSLIFTNISTGFRTPTVKQVYAGDIRGGKYQNNEDIKTQKTINYEMGLRGNKSIFDNDLSYEVSIFQTDNKDIIGKVDGTYYSGAAIWYENVGDTRNRGLELSLKSDSSKTISHNLAYTYLKSEYTKHNPFIVSLSGPDKTYDIVGNEVPRNPSHILDLYTTYKATDNLKFISEVYAKSDYYADETNLVKMPGYAVLNLQARYNTKVQGNKVEFFAKINNVFDKQFYRTVYLFRDKNSDAVLDAEDASITVDPGREFYAGIKYTF